MGLKKIIEIRLKQLLQKFECENIFSLDVDSNIHNSIKATSSIFKGKVFVNENAFITKSNLIGNINIGKSVRISESILSGDVKIGNHSKIIDGVQLHGNIEIGRNTTLNGPNTDFRSVINNIIIGNFCSIARNVTFQEYNHDFSKLTSYFVKCNMEGKSMKEDVVSKGAIIVGHDVWIGTQCVVLSGAKIGTGSVIAANSVVSGEIPPYAIVAGSPAKVIKYRFDEKTIEELLQSEWWNKSKEEVIELYNRFAERK
jgi:virginiamycin A acetyltransferase